MPSASEGAAEVMTAILGHGVIFQSSSQLFGFGFRPVADAKFV